MEEADAHNKGGKEVPVSATERSFVSGYRPYVKRHSFPSIGTRVLSSEGGVSEG